MLLGMLLGLDMLLGGLGGSSGMPLSGKNAPARPVPLIAKMSTFGECTPDGRVHAAVAYYEFIFVGCVQYSEKVINTHLFARR